MHKTPADLVQPMLLIKGSFEITNKALYFHPNVEQDDTPPVDKGTPPKERKWPLSELVEIHFRRYQRRRSALSCSSRPHQLLLEFQQHA